VQAKVEVRERGSTLLKGRIMDSDGWFRLGGIEVSWFKPDKCWG
jgi:hypothetical protein